MTISHFPSKRSGSPLGGGSGFLSGSSNEILISEDTYTDILVTPPGNRDIAIFGGNPLSPGSYRIDYIQGAMTAIPADGWNYLLDGLKLIGKTLVGGVNYDIGDIIFFDGYFSFIHYDTIEACELANRGVSLSFILTDPSYVYINNEGDHVNDPVSIRSPFFRTYKL